MTPLNINKVISAWLAWLIIAAIIIGGIIKLISLLVSWANHDPIDPKHDAAVAPPGIHAPAVPGEPEENDPALD